MPDKKYRISLSLNSLNLSNKFSNVIRSVGGFEIIDPSDTHRADLVILEIGINPTDTLNTIKSSMDSGNVEDVFLTAETAESSLLVKAMRLGVKEFFMQPINVEEVSNALERFKERKLKPTESPAVKNGHIISVFGSKGGVGTTSISVNLSVSMTASRKGLSVILLDMNTLFGEIPLFLEISPKYHWGEITKNIDRLDENFLMNTISQHKTGVHVLPSPAHLNGHIRATPDIMSRILGLARKMFDFVIIDCGQSTNDTALKALQMTDIMLLVTTLSLPCLANTNKLLKSFSDLGYIDQKRIKIVLNRHVKNSDISIKDAAAGIGKDIYWTIPNDYAATMSAINNGKPLLQVAPRSLVTKSFLEMANLLISNRKEKLIKVRSLFNK
jgi:pilus assembly protein CpaE